MTANDTVATFKCPSCGAPLPVPTEAGKTFTQCSYCSETVSIPKDMRIPARPAYVPSPQPPRTRTAPPASVPARSVSPSSRRRAVLVAALVVVLGLAIYVAVRHNFAFAHPVTSFGAKGIGAGLFEDPRFLGVDGSGNIVVADYTDGRVQVFAPGGKYLSMFTVMNAAGKPANAFHIAVGQDGRIYVANGDIQVYAADGRLSGKISAAGNHAYNGALTVGPDGRLYALTDNGSGDLVRFNADGSIDLDVPNAVAVVSSAGYLRAELAVDGLGNIYIAAETVILKYSPEGKFLDQFGGKADDPKFFQPGKFHDIWGIAIDGYGRIFVSDDFDLQVLDANGAYLNKISDSYAGLAFDAQNHLYASMVVGTRKVFEFQIQKPLQQ